MKKIKTNLKDTDTVTIKQKNKEVEMTIADLKSELSISTAGTYKVWRGMLTQSGISAPTAVVLENTLGGDITWSRTGAGAYRGTLAGVITDTTLIFVQNVYNSDPTCQVFAQGFTDDYVQIQTYVDSLGYNATDGLLVSSPVEIRVYGTVND